MAKQRDYSKWAIWPLAFGERGWMRPPCARQRRAAKRILACDLAQPCYNPPPLDSLNKTRFAVYTFCLLSSALIVGQNFDRTEWRLNPQFNQGLELVYKGTFTEESLIPGVQYQRRYALETLFFVDNNKAGKKEAAIMTSLTLMNGKYTDKTPPGAVRLERVRFNQHGRVFGDDATQALLTVPLTAPAMLEAGAFIEFPAVPVNLQSYWEEFEEGRPLRGWRIQGIEERSGARCVKLIGSQQSPDWKEPRADSDAWRRTDVIWFAPQASVVFRVERTIERKDPAHNQPTRRLLAVYDLESRLSYSGSLFEDRKQEIAKVRKYLEDAEPLLRSQPQYRGQIEAMQRRIVKYLESTSPTPYRKAMTHLANSARTRPARRSTPGQRCR